MFLQWFGGIVREREERKRKKENKEINQQNLESKALTLDGV